jgi:hypothetical protein
MTLSASARPQSAASEMAFGESGSSLPPHALRTAADAMIANMSKLRIV